MEQFVAVALAHFLALLVSGVDFFMIVRTALVHGWRLATGVCVGIACANGLFITVAFTGLNLVSNQSLLNTIQALGGIFLIYVGWAFLRSPRKIALDQDLSSVSPSWWKNVVLGLASGLSNPKNVLFYVSLVAALGDIGPLTATGYGSWMVTVVLGWDLLVAATVDRYKNVDRLMIVLPWVTAAAGAFLAVFGASMLVELAVEFGS